MLRLKATVVGILNDLNETGAGAYAIAHSRVRSEPERLHVSSINGGGRRRPWLL